MVSAAVRRRITENVIADALSRCFYSKMIPYKEENTEDNETSKDAANHLTNLDASCHSGTG